MYEDLRKKAQEVRDEVKIGANTANRVGYVLDATVQILERLKESIDELNDNKTDKTQIVQTTGSLPDRIMSQKSVSQEFESIRQLVEKSGKNLTGFVVKASIEELPNTPSTLGYLVGSRLYVYVGSGGDTNNGKYKDCGEFRGPQGESASVVDNLISDKTNEALSANQGRILYGKISQVEQILDGKLAALIANAPEELNTLKEVADYIAEDMEQRAQMKNSIASLLWGSATFTMTGGGVKHVGTNVPITVTATFTSAELIPESIVITDNAGTAVQTVNNSKTASYSGNLNNKVAGDYAFNGKATVGSNVKTAKTTFQLRNKIYCGMGTSYTEVAVDANALTPKTTAVGTYTKTASADGQRFFLLVPEDVTAPNKDKFTMGGAPVGITQTTQTINDIPYKVFQTDGTYPSGTSLTINCQ